MHSATQTRAEQTSLSTLDSFEDLLADVMGELNEALSAMSSDDRSHAVAEIHTIAEGVRLRQGQSAGR